MILSCFLRIWRLLRDFLLYLSDDATHCILLCFLNSLDNFRVNFFVFYRSLINLLSHLFSEIVDRGHEIRVVVELVEHILQVFDIQA